MPTSQIPVLSTKDKQTIAVQAALRAIPYVGTALEHLMFSHLNTLRMRRIEQTLAEIAANLGEEKAQRLVSESFINLLESVAPDLARSVDESKRRRIRDLLYNAALHQATDSMLEEAKLAAQLIRDVEPPGLALLAAMALVNFPEAATVTSKPESQVVVGAFDYDRATLAGQQLHYPWVLIEFWVRRLVELKLLAVGSSDARGGFGAVQLTDLGRFLVRWCVERE